MVHTLKSATTNLLFPVLAPDLNKQIASLRYIVQAILLRFSSFVTFPTLPLAAPPSVLTNPKGAFFEELGYLSVSPFFISFLY